MRVRCVRIVSPATGAVLADSPWLRVGGEYAVLTVMAEPERRPLLRVLHEGGPSLWDSGMFETVDDRLPDSWVARVRDGGIVEFGPARWLEPGFWEAYFDDDPRAVTSYEDELARMYPP